MLPITRSSQFETDLAEIISYLGERNPDAAIRVLDSIEETVSIIAKNPKLGFHPNYLIREQDENVRVKIVLEFPNYLIFYEEIGGNLHLHRALHSSRDLPSTF